MKQRKQIHRVPTVMVACLLVVLIAAMYVVQLNKAVSGNVIQSISELAEHDQKNIQSYVEANWEDLRYIEGKFLSYHCDTLEEVETELNIECANSDFSHIYLLGEDGKVYTDKYLIYDPESAGQNGRIDLLPYFEDAGDTVVARFDDKLTMAGVSKESILYGVRLEDFSVEGITMVALVGIREISDIRDKLAISSFTKDGVSRGYSAVVDMEGNYIVNIGQANYINQSDSFVQRIDGSQSTDMTAEEIFDRMAAGETFSFQHTNAEGVARINYCMPFEDEGIQWYFVSSVEMSVFNDQNETFMTMTLVTLFAIALVAVVLMAVVMVAQKRIITANAEYKAQSNFLANMSHEIRTPLNGIIGLVFLMEKDLEENQNVTLLQTRLGKVKETAQYLLSLINNILDISKFQAGKVEVNQEVISPDTITDAIWSMQRSNIENRGIRFVVEKDISVPWIIGDDLFIKQVLMNILGNAAKFTPEDGQITLSVAQAKEDETHVATTFICADTGCGMSEEFQQHIWDSFAQERGKNTESIKGTGLGMTISKLLMDAMGGEISVNSKLGQGSTFYVTLHSEIAPEPPVTESHELPEDYLSGDNPMKIMVVEDNELNAEILLEILEGEGFAVAHAADGQQAVELFQNSEIGEFNVILMDMQMPIMDGCQATQEIRRLSRPDADTVMIFACTANNFNEDRDAAEQSGMNDFLAKPIDVQELLKKLGQMYAVGAQLGGKRP